MYNRRDQIGHWVRKDQGALEPCTHACCRGYRAHPHNWPVIPANRQLRGASEAQLSMHFRTLSQMEDKKARTGELQILHEWYRREEAETKARDRARQKEIQKEAIAANRAAARQEREAEYERIRRDAERHTVGYLVNAKGRARGVSDAEVLTGRRDVFNRYATDEAKDYFKANPRPTVSYFRGRDTRAHEQATEWRRRARGVRAA